jgi:type II secretory pathway component PulF
MPHFHFRAANANGKIVTGTLEMISEPSLRSHLKNQGYVVLKVEEKKDFIGGAPKLSIKNEHLVLFTSQLAELLKASLPLDQSLEALEEQTQNSELRALIASIKEKIRRGQSFSEVLNEYPTVFPPLYRACVEAGESIGSIGDSVFRMNTLLSSKMKVQQKILSLLLYPIMLFCLLVAAVLILSFFVIPSIEGLFEGKDLPTFTYLVFSISHILKEYWLLGLLLLAVGSMGVVFFLRKPKVREEISRQLLHWPLIGHFLLLSSVSRFATTLSLLLQGGLTLVKALELSKESIANPAMKQELQQVIDGLMNGERLSALFKRSDLFPPLVGRFAYLGEETGKMGELFAHIGTLYEEESSRTLERSVNVLQPILLLIMGTIIGTSILAILLPLSSFGSMADL